MPQKVMGTPEQKEAPFANSLLSALSSCKGAEDRAYSVAALEAANLATAWHIVLPPNFIFALSR